MKKVIVIGLDGLEPAIVEGMLADPGPTILDALGVPRSPATEGSSLLQ
jgi:hypothetical protein